MTDAIVVLRTTRRLVARASRTRFMWEAVAVLLGMAAVAAFHYTAAPGVRDTIIFMGFDTERAILLTASIGAALAGAVAGAVGRSRLSAAAAGLLGLAALFIRTFMIETSRAAQGGTIGQFDPVGWVVTTVALVAAGLLIGLGAGILVREARGGVMALAAGLSTAWRARDRRAIPRARLVAALAVVLGLIIAVPVTGQLLNFGPDSLMLSGGGPRIPIVVLPGTALSPNAVAAGGSAVSVPASGASRPWMAWRPTGAGQVVQRSLPGPWTGGESTTATFWVYLPPGYGSGSRRYPVVYEIPWAIALFDKGTGIRASLDSLIDAGVLPATIVVFQTSNGGPFVDNECIDAAGNREWFDTYVGTTLVRYVDAHFRTIAEPAARTLMGDSQGGFCAANVLLHHPDVFHQEISMSGYYMAAPILRVSPSAAEPYAGGGAALQRENSPMLELSTIPRALRAELMFTLTGNPQQAFYGGQMTAFTALGRRLGFRVATVVSPLGHSWAGVRATMPSALYAVAEREVVEGVFGPAVT